MANGRTATKTKTSTATTTAVALGTVGFAVAAAAALAFNYNELRATTSPSTAYSVAAGTTPTAPGTTRTVTTPVGPFSAGACRSTPPSLADLTLDFGNVTRSGFGTTRGIVTIQTTNNGDADATSYTLKCIERFPSGAYGALPDQVIRLLGPRRRRTDTVEFSPTAVRVQCYADATTQVTESNECNNIGDWSVESPI